MGAPERASMPEQRTYIWEQEGWPAFQVRWADLHPRLLATRERRAELLATVRLIAPELYRPIGIIHRQRKVFTPTAAKFVELLKEVQLQDCEESSDVDVDRSKSRSGFPA